MISLDPENQDGGFQGNGFSSLFSSLQFRINCAWHKHDVYPKECLVAFLWINDVAPCTGGSKDW